MMRSVRPPSRSDPRTAVSYTHLDVYKRQRQNFVKVSPDALMNRECGISATCCWGAEGGVREATTQAADTNWQMRARRLTVASFARGNIHHTED